MQSLYFNTFVAIAVLTFLIAAYAISNGSILNIDTTAPLPSNSSLILLAVSAIGLTAIRRK